MIKLIKHKNIYVFFSFFFLTSCQTKTILEDGKVLVTFDGISGISISGKLKDVINKETCYEHEIRNVEKHGVKFKRLILKIDDEDIAFVSYNENPLSYTNALPIVCIHPKCKTKDGLSVGMGIEKFKEIYPQKSYELKGGIADSIGYFKPEKLTKKDKLIGFALSRVVVELIDVKGDTIVRALIVESG